MFGLNSKSQSDTIKDTDLDAVISESDNDDTDNKKTSADGRPTDLGIKDQKQPFLSEYPKTVHPGFLEQSGENTASDTDTVGQCHVNILSVHF